MTDKYYFDWSHGKVTVLKNDEEDHTNYFTLFDLLNTIKEPSILIGEATFESFFRDTRRNEFIERAEREGHTILTTPNRATGRHRVALGYTEKTDEIDVQVIRSIANSNVHLKVPGVFNDEDPFHQIRHEANRKLMLLRASKVQIPKKRGDGFLKGTKSQKDFYAEEIISRLPDYDTLDEDLQVSLGNKDGYNKVIVAAVGVCADFVSTQRAFDKLSGLYHHGYPSQIRSDLHLWGYSRRIRGTVPITTYRRALRWLFQAIKDLPVEAPSSLVDS
jgi:hypothetical protein